MLPDESISHLVHSFWLLENKTGKAISSTVLPNGMVDMTLMKPKEGNWEILLRGIDPMPSQVTIEADTQLFAIGFTVLAVEYVFGQSIKEVRNEGIPVSTDFWQFDEDDLSSLESFCTKATQRIKTRSVADIDSRKKRLFALIDASHGTMPVKELSENAYWSSRQINRYFNQQVGISLKTYCRILRFGTSFKHISEGNLFPEQPFTDQNHFIKEIKKYAGVTPKALRQNKDDHFMNMVAIKKLPPKNG